jgi:hypothetical protein
LIQTCVGSLAVLSQNEQRFMAGTSEILSRRETNYVWIVR